MRICFVGKYPPIEGGVSSQTYWAVRGLAERGHQVFVVTNADEVEESFRIRLEHADIAMLEPEFANGGSVRIFRPERYSKRMSHIPRSNPFVSKLAGMALQVIEGYSCEMVIGYYLEPYGVAASLAATWAGVGLLLHHAGSDLDRLMRLPELAATYKHVLRSADGVITWPGVAARFLGMGVRPSALRMGPPYALPPSFSPDAAPLDAADIERLASQHAPGPDKAFDPALPTIGMYGKPGELKGTYDLIASLGALRAEGLSFNLLLLSGAWQQEQLSAAITQASLDDRTWRLPFLPHWRVPGFIRACTAVCFLERDFPVAIHGPAVAREVLTCGTCLVLSGEIYDKQRNRDELADDDNIVLVPDPKDRQMLAERLRAVISDPARAAEIGARGRLATAGFPSFADYIDAWEDLLSSVLPGGPGPSPSTAIDLWSGSPADQISGALPWAKPLLDSELDVIVERFSAVDADQSPGTGASLAERFCGFLADHASGPVRDVARYQRARLWARREEPGPPPLPAGNELSGRPPTAEAMRELYPFRHVPVRFGRFEYDVTPVLCASDAPDVTDPAVIGRQPTLVCFAKMPNFAPVELKLNEVAASLLEQCSGERPAQALVAELAQRLVPSAGPERDRTVSNAFTALAWFYGSGVIGFASRPAHAVPVDEG